MLKIFINPIRKLYDKTLALSKHPKAFWWLMAVTFTESIFFPIPQDIMLVPMMLSERKKAFFYATWCSIVSVLGGIVGYFVGVFLYNEFALPLLEFYGYLDKVSSLKTLYAEYGWWIVFIGGFTPIPYKVITIISGVMGMNIYVFIFAAIVSRASRFYLLAILVYILGDKILEFIDKYFTLLTILVILLLMGIFFMLKFVI